jgi:ribosomal protein S18 acetylase RimI-like enzyme
MSGRSFLGAFAMPDALETELSIDEARSLGDYLFLRALRNEVRGLMTNHTEPIGYWQQFRFYRAMRGRSLPITIFIARQRGRRAGYLLIRETGDGAAVTEAIDEQFRQQGIGRKLLAFAQQRYANLLAEIRADNAGSIKLHESMGFVRESVAGGILTYRFRK